MKRQIYILIALVVVSLIIGGLAYASARYEVKTITKAIDAIGEVSYSEECRQLIDKANDRLASLDPNLKLTEKISNIDALKAAKVRYVESAITRLFRAYRDKDARDEETIKQYLSDAQAAFDAYLTPDDIPLVRNYADLEKIAGEYGEPQGKSLLDTAPNLTPQDTEIDLC